MADYVSAFTYNNHVSVSFEAEDPKVMALGEKLYALCPDAYMNGYNWDAFFNYYLARHAPDILESIDPDPEAGSYLAYFEETPENEEKALRFADIIVSLIENPEEIYQIIRDHADDIEWD